MANKTQIIRSANSSGSNFTPISNLLLKNENISLETVALVSYIVHLPPDWIIYKSHIEKEMLKRGCGGTKFRRIWKEAKDNGYIIQNKFRIDNGTYDYHYEVSDNEITTSTLSTHGSSTGGLSTGGLSTRGQRTPILKNKEEKNKEEKNNIKSNNLVLSTSQSEVSTFNPLSSVEKFDLIMNNE
tara:strand:- start:78 stop:629 length:552 start_codon:yes stop_codon:yes gene_type:complete